MVLYLLLNAVMKTNCAKKLPRAKRCPCGGTLVRSGRYFRRGDSKKIQRLRCLKCKRKRSYATHSRNFRQKKRRLHLLLTFLLNSNVSQRRAALILNISRTTVARKFRLLAKQARINQKQTLQELPPITAFQFDEMETFEHTKLKPLSIALAVSTDSRKILAVRVSSMPAKGHLAGLARKKYGPRMDGRKEAAHHVLSIVAGNAHPQAEVTSDMNPKYPGWIRNVSRTWRHLTVKGRDGCIVGQGELKKIGFDPIFSLNHTCAMNRANINRLIRKTWCTTKKMESLQDHLDLYADFHNRILTPN